MNLNPSHQKAFKQRHIGSSANETQEMLNQVGFSTLNELISKTIPEKIRLKKLPVLAVAETEIQFLKRFKTLAEQNQIFTSHIGLGYYNTYTPEVIKRNILENPGWYTAYTPYQAEIAQGRLEMLLNYQTLITDLTGMDLANASLLDEATAAAEAMAMLFAARPNEKNNAKTFFVSNQCFPQTLDLLQLRAAPIGVEIEIGAASDFKPSDAYFGVIFQYPGADGSVYDFKSQFVEMKKQAIGICVASDLMALLLLTPPGEIGADVVIGSAQRFGIGMGYGGPHPAFFATKESFKRLIPGRIIGVTQDVLKEREPCVWLYKPASNILKEKKRLQIFVLLKFYFLLWQHLLLFTMGQKNLNKLVCAYTP